MLQARLARPIFVVARAIPVERTSNAIGLFRRAKICSTAERTRDLAAFACMVRRGIGRPCRFLRWMHERIPLSASHASLFFDRHAVIRPHAGRRVGPVDQPDQLCRVMAGSVSHRPGPDQPMLPVDRHMSLVAESRDREVDDRRRAVRLRLRPSELHRPARVSVLLCRPGRLIGPDLHRRLACP